MAHPHQEHRAHKVEKDRVRHIAKGYARGGAVHPDEAQDKKLIRKMMREHDREVEGEHAKHRADRPHRAKGGRVKKGKGAHVKVIVNAGGQPPHPPIMPPPGLGAAVMPPPPAAAAPPPAMPPRPPMMPPGAAGAMPGPVPGLPPRAGGGRAYAKGGRVKNGPAYDEGLRNGTQVSHDPGKNDLKDMHRGRVITYRTGGRVEAPQKKFSTGRDEAPQHHGSDKRMNAPQHKSSSRRNEAPQHKGSDQTIESRQGVSVATKLPGGAGGGEGRLAKARRASRD